jgi:hypothetical protein
MMGYSEEARRGDPEGHFGVRFRGEAPGGASLVFTWGFLGRPLGRGETRNLGFLR